MIAAEVVEELKACDARLDFPSTRRNILTRGIDVNTLVGRDFAIGDVHCRGQRLAEPCAISNGSKVQDCSVHSSTAAGSVSTS